MTKPSICCVVPSIRPESMTEFRKAWGPLFERHAVTLITVWDGENPVVEVEDNGENSLPSQFYRDQWEFYGDIVCRRTDAVRNLGFIHAAKSPYDYILTLDDDVHPPAGSDPIQEHLDVLARRVPISWMNTAMEGQLTRLNGDKLEDGELKPIYLRGMPYGIRDEAPVKVSHGVWVNVPDFDGRTQLELGKCRCAKGSELPCPPTNCQKCNGTGYDGSRLPYSLPYFRGPVPKGTYLPFCGMNVMVHRDALPYLYFAPMGPDALPCEGCDEGKIAHGPHADGSCCPHCKGKFSELNRFADIWCGILLKRQLDSLGWAMYTGASTVIHTRASDPFKNVEQERLGIEWNEWAWQTAKGSWVDMPEAMLGLFWNYWQSYLNKANRFRQLIRELQGAK